MGERTYRQEPKMKPDRSTMITLIVCLAAVVAALYARTVIYSSIQGTRGDESEQLGRDPYDGGRITIHYHERPPYYITRGNGVGGIIGDRIAFVFSQANIPLAWRKTSAKRQLEIIKANERREGAAGWFKNAQRETFAKFSLPIYRDRPTVALTRADENRIRSGGRLADLLANPDVRLLRKEGYSYGALIDGLIATTRPRQIVTSTDNTGMLNFIHTHRADYFFIAPEEADHLLSESALPGTGFRKITFSDMPAGNRRYILFSRRVESTTIERLNRHISMYAVEAPDTENALK
jgi:polar amino acid transport system substrate-binding protein